MRANSGWFGSKMTTGQFQGLFSALHFYNRLIGKKYGLHFSNQVKINRGLLKTLWCSGSMKKSDHDCDQALIESSWSSA